MAHPAPEGIIEAVVLPAANKGMMVGAVTGVAGWLSQVNWIGLSGVVVAVLGLLINLYFQVRKDRRESAERQARELRDVAERQARELREAAESEARIAMYRERCEVGR